MICALIVAGLAVVNLVAGLKYPPLLVNTAVLAVLVVVIARDLASERRLH